MKKPPDNKKPSRGLSTTETGTKETDYIHKNEVIKRTNEGHFVLPPVERFGFEVFHTSDGGIAVKQTDTFTDETQTIILRSDEALALCGVLRLVTGRKVLS